MSNNIWLPSMASASTTLIVRIHFSCRRNRIMLTGTSIFLISLTFLNTEWTSLPGTCKICAHLLRFVAHYLLRWWDFLLLLIKILICFESFFNLHTLIDLSTVGTNSLATQTQKKSAIDHKFPRIKQILYSFSYLSPTLNPNTQNILLGLVQL